VADSSFTSRFGLSTAALRIIGAVAAVTLLLAVAAVTAIRTWQSHRYLAGRLENASQITFQIEHFLIHHVRQSSQQLAELPAIQQVATGALRPETPEVLVLLRTARMLLAPWSESIVYLMDKSGLVVASTTYGKGQTLTGNNYRFRPYFSRAIAGRPVIYAALGVTTNQRGVYFSSPILTEPNSPPQAVLVIKAGLEEVDHILAKVPQPLALVSAEGVVFATNRPDWLFHTLFALPPQEVAALRASRQFADQPLSPLPFRLDEEQPEPILIGQQAMVPHFHRVTEMEGWRLVTFAPPPAYPLAEILLTLTGLLITGFLAGLSLVNINARRLLLRDLRLRHQELGQINRQLSAEVEERQWAEQELLRHQEKLETMVAERTRELVEANQRLEEEVAERTEAEQRTTAALHEKEALLKEVHHLVKNNLQTISSLFKLQARKTKDADARNALQESQDRLRVMAMIHEKIYRADDLASIPMDDYIKGLAHSLFHIYRTEGQPSVRLLLNIDPTIRLDINTAIPCGLIINELISNALKHAFQGGAEGRLAICFSEAAPGYLLLSVCDNGIGLPSQCQVGSDSLGLHLVTILAEDQLHGSIFIDCSEGTCFYIEFKGGANHGKGQNSCR
jgi:two-component sensor histidine kinase